MDASELRKKIIRSLREQGFSVRNGMVLPPQNLSKEKMRELHQTAVKHKRECSKEGLFRKESKLLSRIASGEEVEPGHISPRLVEVSSQSEEERLFRYASLHWSIPISSGYGRRLRFLVVDEQNNKLIGLIGLGDPVFSLKPRDSWIGWDTEGRKERLKYVMDAFVLGAVPPYSYLLCGKLIAMLVASNEVRNTFQKKYKGTRSIIKQQPYDGRLALITTTSALGRSSIYNRLRFGDNSIYHSVGFTRGSGEFHFSNGLYGVITEYASKYCVPTAKKASWGKGFRNRREIIKKCLPAIGLSSEWLYHGIEREVFVIPLAKNSKEFLQGEHSRLKWYNLSASDIFNYFRERWLLPRCARDERYKSWTRDRWLIWPNGEESHG
ncbi:MAG TPA: Druantia anti-phage system protein DruA [Candidatus Avalokitesvara rifleensis]|uniref:Druantia anti-phage system protein DruA n=1 Tax=Candidatus Avalokitesvara rifleensis TaxID=3367620 RepID=UPI002713FC28|nr:DUF4338 domain-containing protein [Candidatus Brocadiales bacterium]